MDAITASAAPASIPFSRRVLAPLLLTLITPPLSVLLFVIVDRYDGSIARYVAERGWTRLAAELPRPSLWAAAVILGWVAVQWALLSWLPGPAYLGPPSPAGRRPEYKQNGVLAWFVTHALLVLGLATGVLSSSAFVARYGELLATLTTCAFALCIALYWKGVRSPIDGADSVRTGHVIFDFFQGIETHPRVFDTSLKQLVNCRVSMMGWSAIGVTFAARQLGTPEGLSPALAVSTLLLVAYLFKFFWWETGYFTSLDIMHDRFGYYICWGVLAWVPAVYPIAQLYLAMHRQPMGWASAAVVGAIGLGAIAVNYAADEQRQRFRQTNGATKIWGREPVAIVATYRTNEGKERESLLLASGYWGISRHFHYIPEITLALAWSLPAGFDRALPYFYVVFLTVLLVDRANRDDKRCALKYGAAWDSYRKRVPFKIIPGVY